MNNKFLDKVCDQIISETRIIDDKIYTPSYPSYLFPFSPLLFHIFPPAAHFRELLVPSFDQFINSSRIILITLPRTSDLLQAPIEEIPDIPSSDAKILISLPFFLFNHFVNDVQFDQLMSIDLLGVG